MRRKEVETREKRTESETLGGEQSNEGAPLLITIPKMDRPALTGKNDLDLR